MTFSDTTNARIEKRWDGSKFVEGDLTLSGANGVSVDVTASQFTISGNQAAVDSALSTLSGNLSSEIDSDISTYSGFAEGQFVNESGDTMTGFLTLSADPTASGHAANKNYVDDAVQSGIEASTVAVKDDNSIVVSGANTLDFGHAIDVAASGSSEAEISVDESEFTTVVFLTGNQTVGGQKTFSDNATFNGDVQIDGDLTVTGTTTTLNTEELLVEDNLVVLNSTVTGTPSVDAGIAIERGSSADAHLLWDESLDRWVAGISGSFSADDDVIVLRSELETASGDLSSEIDSDISSYSGYAEGAFVNESGDTMTGFLTLSADPTASGHAANKNYVDTISGSLSSEIDSDISTYSGFAEGQFVNESGDTMTGFLTLSADPTAALHAATKQYVDAQVSSGIEAANVTVEDDGVVVGSGIQVLDFGNGLDATLSGSVESLVTVNEAELTTLMHLANAETATGKKTFSAGLAVASGVAPANSADTQGGVEGEIRWDDDFAYIYTGSAWRRTAIASF